MLSRLFGAAVLLAALCRPVAAADFQNPIIWDDFADLEVIRVDDTFYYTASTMHYSPGAPVLKSYDLVNWEYVGHSVPELSFGDKYDLAGGASGYRAGIWASSLQYRQSDGHFYWLGCIDFSQTHIFKAPNAEGPWEKIALLGQCYYDAGLMFDDDDNVYVAYGSTDIEVAQLSNDCTSEIKSQVVYSADMYIEGARMNKINGVYYIFVTRAPDAEFVLKADNPFGPYEIRNLVDRIASPVANTGPPHQGGIVDTPNGDWYYVGFIDAYPLGRNPVLAPITWGSDGWPTLSKVNDAWGAQYPMPVVTDKKGTHPIGTYTFGEPALHHQWEWNHNPDNDKWSLLPDDGGLRLQAATVTDDLYLARNTLTHRIRGPKSRGTFRLSVTDLADGDRAGAAVLRDRSAYVGVWKEGGEARIVAVAGMTMDDDWKTASKGQVVADGPVLADGAEVWLRVEADVTPAFNGGRPGVATFWYSVDGGEEGSFKQIGPAFQFDNSWEFFMAYRYAVFNHATKALGGSLLVKSFTLEEM